MATKTTPTRKPREKVPAGGSVVVPVEPSGPAASPYKGIYLDDESRTRLLELETQTGKSASRIIRELIKNADGHKMARLAALADEIKSLLK